MTTKQFFCNSCNAGPWFEYENGGDGKSIVFFHRTLKHDMVEYVEPKLRGKANWGYTDIEKEFTNYMISNFDKIFKEYLR